MTPDATQDATPAMAAAVIAECAAARGDASRRRRTAPEELGPRVEALLVRARSALAGGDPTWRATYALLLVEQRALRDHDLDVPHEVRQAMWSTADELRTCRSPRALMDTAADSMRLATGFTRVLFSAVRGTRWVPLVVRTDPDVDPDPSALQAFLDERNEIPLANLLAETEMVRRHSAVLVEGASLALRTFKPIVVAAGSSGYVGAPILVDGTVIGIVHGDRVGQLRGVTETDRQILGEFAHTFALLFDRVSSAERLGRLTRLTEGDLESTRHELHRIGGEPQRFGPRERPSTPSRGAAPGTTERDLLLTRREREVLELVSHGATNRMAAERLTVSEETVKSHMRTIFRKLHVTSRSAAVARFRRAGSRG